MPVKRVEDVFKVSGGVPPYTFVYPTFYNTLKVALRTSGRGVVIEGPSGIGKSTSVAKAFAELADGSPVTQLSARVPGDVDLIQMLPQMKDFGTIVVDDFHRLPESIRQALSDLLKVLADTGSPKNKLVIVGINQAGNELIEMAPDLANRVDIIRFEVEPNEKIAELITLGEKELNITIASRDQVIEAAHGSFYLAQMLCRDLCLQANVLEEQYELVDVATSYSSVKRQIMERQKIRFGKALFDFVRGTKFRPGGRAPYLHILRWLADSDVWSVSLKEEMKKKPQERPSVSVVVDQGYLLRLVSQEHIAQILHFNASTQVLSVEDPHLIFYLRNLDWPAFIAEAGFTKVEFEHPYDVALSFAGEDRAFAEQLRDQLEDLGHSVFYDLAEQSRILAKNVADYLRPIYQSEAAFVVAVLGEKYGEKRWTIFESDQFKHRIEKGEVIPIWSKAVPRSAFDATRDIGGMTFDPDADLSDQARQMAEVISRKIAG